MKNTLLTISALGALTAASYGALSITTVAEYSLGTGGLGTFAATGASPVTDATGTTFNGTDTDYLGSAVINGGNTWDDADLSGTWGTVGDTGVRISATVTVGAANQTQAIIFGDGHGGSGVGVYQDGNGFGIYAGGNGATFWHVGATAITAGQTYALMVQNNPENGLTELYVDGNLEQSYAFGGTKGGAGGAAVGNQFSGGFAFDGKVSDIGFYDLTVVPEPSSAALLGLGTLALIMRRRK